MKPNSAGLAGPGVVVLFFALKIGSAIALLTASTAWMSVDNFATFTQLMILTALLNLAAIGGAQSGLVKMTAASADLAAIARVQGAAYLVWITLFAVLIVLFWAFRDAVSIALVGDTRVAAVVPLIALLVLASGPGQIFTSILTGRHRPAVSMLAQTGGLVASTVGALWFLHQGNAAVAAVAFAAGPLVTMAIAFPAYLTERLPRPSLKELRGDIRHLLSYSGATAVLAVGGALILFALRAVYRDSFGLETLAFWLAASRISDTTTQFLGLAILQLFLPRYSAANNQVERRHLILVTSVTSALLMGGGLVLFGVASEFWVGLLLSPAYRPATTGILLYMIGDLLRVTAAVAMNVQLANGRPWRYAAIEVATLVLMATICLAGIARGEPLAPMIAYVAAYTVTALIVCWQFARDSMAVRTSRVNEQ